MTEGWWIFSAGLIITAFSWWISRVWMHARNLNRHRLIILEHVNETAIPLTERFIADSNAAIDILRVKKMTLFNELSRSIRLERLPMLNSSMLRSILPTLLKEVIISTSTITSIGNYCGALDYMMEQTAGSAVSEFTKAATAHLASRKDDKGYFSTDEDDFRFCQIIESKRDLAIRNISGRMKRAHN